MRSRNVTKQQGKEILDILQFKMAAGVLEVGMREHGIECTDNLVIARKGKEVEWPMTSTH